MLNNIKILNQYLRLLNFFANLLVLQTWFWDQIFVIPEY